MDGSLNDRFIVDSKNNRRWIRPRVTLGFPITLVPDKRHRNAVAVVEVEVETEAANDVSPGGEAPAITALLPREKTYNVASITDSSSSIGAGAVTQVASFGASFLRSRKTFYVVQDQDTVALPVPPPTGECALRKTAFAWQFRPVLGKEFVRTGMKQTFVQLAFPSPVDAPIFGHARIKTYWRKYDRVRNLVGDVIPGSLQVRKEPIEIPSFDVSPNLQAFGVSNLEDLGNGNMLVTLVGRFLTGTTIRVGGDLLQPGSRMMLTYNLIRFVAPIADLATKRTFVVNRDGSETQLFLSSNAIDLSHPPKFREPPTLTPIDDGMSLLTIKPEPMLEAFPLVVIIGNRVFGYSDAPVKRANGQITLALPTAFFDVNRRLTIRPLLVDDRYAAEAEILDPAATVERVVVAERGDTVKFLLYGRNLKDLELVVPADATLDAIEKDNDDGTLRLLKVKADVAKGLKQLVLHRKGARPFTVDVPPPPPEPKEKKEGA